MNSANCAKCQSPWEEKYPYTAEWDFIFTSAGDVLRREDEKLVPCVASSINVQEFSQKLGRTPQEADYRAEFLLRAEESLTYCEYLLYERIYDLQRLNTSRFRIYGGISRGKPQVRLVTEFLGFDEGDDEFWCNLAAMADALGGHIETIYTSEHLDHVIEDCDGPNRREVYGPRHGDPTTQVEVWWDVTKMTYVQVAELIATRLLSSENLWHSHGVGVL